MICNAEEPCPKTDSIFGIYDVPALGNYRMTIIPRISSTKKFSNYTFYFLALLFIIRKLATPIAPITATSITGIIDGFILFVLKIPSG
jgi:hypothetical protein